jgi:hypothetical protein
MGGELPSSDMPGRTNKLARGLHLFGRSAMFVPANGRPLGGEFEAMNPHSLYLLKLFWGTVFAGVFLCWFFSFLKRAAKAKGVKYNWFAVVLSFSTMGLALYLIFFAQI